MATLPMPKKWLDGDFLSDDVPNANSLADLVRLHEEALMKEARETGDPNEVRKMQAQIDAHRKRGLN